MPANAIHGNKSQSQRERALADFKAGRIRVLVATDIAARGIDVTGVSHVVNFELPNVPESYVHRIGRNACTAMEFRRLIAALDYPQPSVTKVGGISEFLAVAKLADVAGKPLMPHSPYFGPGYWATLQLAAHLDHIGLFEFLYVQPAAFCGRDIPLPSNGRIAIPDTPGIGFEPDEGVLNRYRVA